MTFKLIKISHSSEISPRRSVLKSPGTLLLGTWHSSILETWSPSVLDIIQLLLFSHEPFVVSKACLCDLPLPLHAFEGTSWRESLLCHASLVLFAHPFPSSLAFLKASFLFKVQASVLGLVYLSVSCFVNVAQLLVLPSILPVKLQAPR